MRNNFFFKSPINNPKKIIVFKSKPKVEEENKKIDFMDVCKYNDFDWEQYIRFYKDLDFMKTKAEAIKHWEMNGEKEGRKYFKVSWDETEDYENFDWEKYVKYYKDLDFMKTKAEAFNHWILNGKEEGRRFFKINDEYERLWPF